MEILQLNDSKISSSSSSWLPKLLNDLCVTHFFLKEVQALSLVPYYRSVRCFVIAVKFVNCRVLCHVQCHALCVMCPVPCIIHHVSLVMCYLSCGIR